MKNLIRYGLLIASCILAGISIGCDTDAKVTPEDPEGATIEWKEVSQAVAELFAEFDPPLERNLEGEDRVDWVNCAGRPEDATQNMTGSLSITGKKPLLAFFPEKNGGQSLSVSEFLGRDQTEWWYWIDKWGSIHLVIMK